MVKAEEAMEEEEMVTEVEARATAVVATAVVVMATPAVEASSGRRVSGCSPSAARAPPTVRGAP